MSKERFKVKGRTGFGNYTEGKENRLERFGVKG